MDIRRLIFFVRKGRPYLEQLWHKSFESVTFPYPFCRKTVFPIILNSHLFKFTEAHLCHHEPSQNCHEPMSKRLFFLHHYFIIWSISFKGNGKYCLKFPAKAIYGKISLSLGVIWVIFCLPFKAITSHGCPNFNHEFETRSYGGNLIIHRSHYQICVQHLPE